MRLDIPAQYIIKRNELNFYSKVLPKSKISDKWLLRQLSRNYDRDTMLFRALDPANQDVHTLVLASIQNDKIVYLYNPLQKVDSPTHSTVYATALDAMDRPSPVKLPVSKLQDQVLALTTIGAANLYELRTADVDPVEAADTAAEQAKETDGPSGPARLHFPESVNSEDKPVIAAFPRWLFLPPGVKLPSGKVSKMNLDKELIRYEPAEVWLRAMQHLIKYNESSSISDGLGLFPHPHTFDPEALTMPSQKFEPSLDTKHDVAILSPLADSDTYHTALDLFDERNSIVYFLSIHGWGLVDEADHADKELLDVKIPGSSREPDSSPDTSPDPTPPTETPPTESSPPPAPTTTPPRAPSIDLTGDDPSNSGLMNDAANFFRHAGNLMQRLQGGADLTPGGGDGDPASTTTTDANQAAEEIVDRYRIIGLGHSDTSDPVIPELNPLFIDFLREPTTGGKHRTKLRELLTTKISEVSDARTDISTNVNMDPYTLLDNYTTNCFHSANWLSVSPNTQPDHLRHRLNVFVFSAPPNNNSAYNERLSESQYAHQQEIAGEQGRHIKARRADLFVEGWHTNYYGLQQTLANLYTILTCIYQDPGSTLIGQLVDSYWRQLHKHPARAFHNNRKIQHTEWISSNALADIQTLLSSMAELSEQPLMRRSIRSGSTSPMKDIVTEHYRTAYSSFDDYIKACRQNQAGSSYTSEPAFLHIVRPNTKTDKTDKKRAAADTASSTTTTKSPKTSSNTNPNGNTNPRPRNTSPNAPGWINFTKINPTDTRPAPPPTVGLLRSASSQGNKQLCLNYCTKGFNCPLGSQCSRWHFNNISDVHRDDRQKIKDWVHNAPTLAFCDNTAHPTGTNNNN